MTEEEIKALLKATPRYVLIAAYLSVLLGLVAASRIGLTHFTKDLATEKAVGYAVLWFLFLAIDGLGLITRSKSGYVFLLIFIAIPLFGAFAYSVHLLRLLLTGEWHSSGAMVVYCVLSVVQLCLSLGLIPLILARTVRRHVWVREMSEPAGAEL